MRRHMCVFEHGLCGRTKDDIILLPLLGFNAGTVCCYCNYQHAHARVPLTDVYKPEMKSPTTFLTFLWIRCTYFNFCWSPCQVNKTTSEERKDTHVCLAIKGAHVAVAGRIIRVDASRRLFQVRRHISCEYYLFANDLQIIQAVIFNTRIQAHSSASAWH